MALAGTVALNEIQKRMILLWSYKFNFVTQMFMIGLIFVGISFFMAGGQPQPEMLASGLVGYLIWFFALAAISDMSWGIREETQTGTLEQMYMSPLPTGVLMLSRSVASLVINMMMVGVAGVVLVLILGISLPLTWAALPVFLLTMGGLYGFALILGGTTLIFKQVEALANLLQNTLLFLNGALLPVDRLPGWMEAIAKTLPTTQGIIVLRQVILDGQTLAQTWQSGSLVGLVINSAVYFVAGWFIFRWCENRARRMGALGQY